MTDNNELKQKEKVAMYTEQIAHVFEEFSNGLIDEPTYRVVIRYLERALWLAKRPKLEKQSEDSAYDGLSRYNWFEPDS